MARGRSMNRHHKERIKAMTARKLREARWYAEDDLSPEEWEKIVGIHGRSRCRCSCDYCQPEEFRLTKAGRRIEAITHDELKEVGE